MDIAERITIISIIVTTSVGLAEFTAGAIFGSVAVVAAGMDAIADTATSVGVIAGLHVSKRPPDESHHYGHRQAETLASAFLSAALVFAGIRIAYLAVDNIRQGTTVNASIPLFITALAAVVISAVLAKYKMSIGKKTGNMSVVADGYHTLTDGLSAAAVLVGLVFVRMGYNMADSIVALGVSVLVVGWGFRVGLNAINIIMEKSPGPKVMRNIRKVVLSVPGVRDCHKLRARKVGSRISADLHIQVDPRTHVDKAHIIATKVERRLQEKIPDIHSVVVHIEPIEGKSDEVRSRRKS
jgi:cation diffusion facilitator family transporter